MCECVSHAPTPLLPDFCFFRSCPLSCPALRAGGGRRPRARSPLTRNRRRENDAREGSGELAEGHDGRKRGKGRRLKAAERRVRMPSSQPFQAAPLRASLPISFVFNRAHNVFSCLDLFAPFSLPRFTFLFLLILLCASPLSASRVEGAGGGGGRRQNRLRDRGDQREVSGKT